jgi:hypothetical protein
MIRPINIAPWFDGGGMAIESTHLGVTVLPEFQGTIPQGQGRSKQTAVLSKKAHAESGAGSASDIEIP